MKYRDMVYLLFGQAMPALDPGVRGDITSYLAESEWGLAMDLLLWSINEQSIPVDQGLLREVRASRMTPA